MDLILTLMIHSLIVAILMAHRMDLFKEVSNIFNIFVTGTSPAVGAFLADGTYSDGRGRKVGTVDDGQWKWTTHAPAFTKPPPAPQPTTTTAPGVVGSKEWLQQPKIQEQLQEMENLFKREVIRAIHEGRSPPGSDYTRQSLLRDWDDEWQTLANKMGIKLFEKRKTVGTPGPTMWVDIKPGSELKLRTGSNPPPTFAKPKPPPNPPPATTRAGPPR